MAMKDAEERRPAQSRPIQCRYHLNNLHKTRSDQLNSRCHSGAGDAIPNQQSLIPLARPPLMTTVFANRSV